MADTNRIMKELREIASDVASQVKVTQHGDSLVHMKGTIAGPSDTVYEGGTFHVDIQIGASYPFEPPKMKFLTKVWHPNVSSQTGAICLDVLKDQWSPALTLKTALLSCQALLAAPEPDDPQDAQVARMYTERRGEFDETARAWTKKYATADQKDPVVGELMEMGFSEGAVLKALTKCGGNKDRAVEELLGGGVNAVVVGFVRANDARRRNKLSRRNSTTQRVVRRDCSSGYG